MNLVFDLRSKVRFPFMVRIRFSTFCSKFLDFF